MTGAKIALLGSAGLGVVNMVPGDYEKLGIVGVLIVALIAVWKAGAKREQQLYELHERSIQQIQASTDAIVNINATIMKCNAANNNSQK